MERILKKNTVVTLLAKAEIASFVMSAIILLITSAFMLKMDLSATVVTIFVIATYIISNLLSGYIVGKCMGHKKFLWGLLSGAVYFMVIFLLSVIAMGTGEFNLFSTVRTLMICILAGMFGGMIS